MIALKGITKTYRVAKRAPGLLAAVKALGKREYETVEALHSLSFEIGRGEIVGYIGPNGAGKSTTIKIMSGILVPDAGECTILGKTPWKNRVAHVRDIGVVFGQRTQLMWDIPAMDSFELLRDVYKVPKETFRTNLDELVEVFQLAEFMNAPVRQLSLGQRMRCEIAASLLHSPPILFLDEPTIGLDAVSKVAVRQFIKRVNRDNGVTVVLTTHDMNDVDALTDRVMLIGKGRLLYDGSFETMKNRYNTTSLLTVEYDPAQILPAMPYTRFVSDESGRAVLEVDTLQTTISAAITALSQAVTVQNVTVQPRPVEEIIADAYKEFAL